MCIRDEEFGGTVFFSLHGRINVMRSQGEGRETLKLLMCHKIDLHLIHAILVMMLLQYFLLNPFTPVSANWHL